MLGTALEAGGFEAGGEEVREVRADLGADEARGGGAGTAAIGALRARLAPQLRGVLLPGASSPGWGPSQVPH